MRFILAVDTSMKVSARLTLRSGGNGGIRRGIALATRGKGTVVFFTMWAPTDRANNTWRLASCSGVIPLAAMLAEWNVHMDTGRANDTREALD